MESQYGEYALAFLSLFSSLLAPFVFMFILSGFSFFMYFNFFYRYATNTVAVALVA